MKLLTGPAEEWRPVIGYADYEASNLGRVRSKDRVISAGSVAGPCTRSLKGKIRRTYFCEQRGVVTVSLCVNGKCSTKKVHHLVLEAFVGPCPDGLEGCHGDGDPTNNTLDNLRWDTQASNVADAKRHGVFSPPPVRRGLANHKCRLSDSDVRAIRAERATGATLLSLSAKYGVSGSHISGVVSRKYRGDVI